MAVTLERPRTTEPDPLAEALKSRSYTAAPDSAINAADDTMVERVDKRADEPLRMPAVPLEAAADRDVKTTRLTLRDNPALWTGGPLDDLKPVPLEAKDLKDISDKYGSVKAPHSTLARAAELVSDLRSAYLDVVEYTPGRLARGASAVFGMALSVLDRVSAKREAFEATAREAADGLKDHYDRNVKPLVEEIRNSFGSRTFTRTADTPPALLAAAIPVEKEKTILSFETLRSRVLESEHVLNKDSDTPVVSAFGKGWVSLSRSVNGTTERLDVAFVREGKVDLYLNGRRLGSLWTDDALKAAEGFAKGRNISIKAKRSHSDYIIPEPGDIT